MDQKNTRWGDKCLDDFLEMFQSNITLLKINWRLESRKSFALNKMITRNNEIDRRKKCGMPYHDLLPTTLQESTAHAPASPQAVHKAAGWEASSGGGSGSGRPSVPDLQVQSVEVSHGKENISGVIRSVCVLV
jgi:hypothetical protein